VFVGVVTFLLAMRKEAWSAFVDSVVGELLQVAWPTREETTRNTTVVVVSTIVFAAILGVFGFLAEQVTRTFLI
jgi:preprotein translocase SecE subunit